MSNEHMPFRNLVYSLEDSWLHAGGADVLSDTAKSRELRFAAYNARDEIFRRTITPATQVRRDPDYRPIIAPGDHVFAAHLFNHECVAFSDAKLDDDADSHTGGMYCAAAVVWHPLECRPVWAQLTCSDLSYHEWGWSMTDEERITARAKHEKEVKTLLATDVWRLSGISTIPEDWCGKTLEETVQNCIKQWRKNCG